jgi:hypothetical protein
MILRCGKYILTVFVTVRRHATLRCAQVTDSQMAVAVQWTSLNHVDGSVTESFDKEIH